MPPLNGNSPTSRALLKPNKKIPPSPKVPSSNLSGGKINYPDKKNINTAHLFHTVTESVRNDTFIRIYKLESLLGGNLLCNLRCQNHNIPTENGLVYSYLNRQIQTKAFLAVSFALFLTH